eukprot:s187_g19.t1
MVSRRKAAKHRAEVELGLSAEQLKNELVEARANAKLRDELNEANLRLADQLTEANANLREELIEVKVELLTAREGRGLHQEELEAEKQAQTISRSSQSQASSMVPSDLRAEHEQALQDLRTAKRAEVSARQDLEKQRLEMRKLREAHQMDMDALAAELQQFQEEHGELEGKLRIKEEREPALRARLEAAQAQVLEELSGYGHVVSMFFAFDCMAAPAEKTYILPHTTKEEKALRSCPSRQGRQQLQRQMRQFQAREREMEFATEQGQELQQQLFAQLADVESKLLVTKEQLQKVREDKMSERQRFERQLVAALRRHRGAVSAAPWHCGSAMSLSPKHAMDDEVDDVTVGLMVQQFLDEWHFRVLHSGLAYAWDRPEALIKAMDIFEAAGMRITLEEKEQLANLEEDWMIEGLVQRMPGAMFLGCRGHASYRKKTIEHFLLQLQLVLSTATREGSPDEIAKIMEDGDTGITQQEIVTEAGREVGELQGIHYSWETSMAGRIARLIRCSEDADNAAIEPWAQRGNFLEIRGIS